MQHYKKLLLMAFVGIIVLLMQSCYYDEVIKSEEAIDVGNVSFAGDIVPIFSQSCAVPGCHNGSVKPDLRADKAFVTLTSGNYVNTISPDKSEVYLWMKGLKNSPMPLTGPNSTYNAKILAWIKKGALND